MKRILFIGKCGFSCGTVVGGEIAKNRVVYKYCKEKYDVRLIDIFWNDRNFIINLRNRTIGNAYRILKLVCNARTCDKIVVDSFHEKYLKIIDALNCSHKVLYVAIGGIVPERIREASLPLSIYSSFEKIFVESEEMRDALIAMGLNNAAYMPNCKYLPHYEPRSGRDFTKKNILKLFYLGQIRKEKGIQVMLDAVKTLNQRDIRFEAYFYGDIFDDIDLKSQINEYIVYEGKLDLLDNAENYDTLRQYDIFIFPTEWKGEGISGAVQDALALGKPIVATNHHMNGKMILNGENGYLFEKGNVAQLVGILERFYENQEMMIQMGNRSLEIANRFRAEEVLSALGI